MQLSAEEIGKKLREFQPSYADAKIGDSELGNAYMKRYGQVSMPDSETEQSSQSSPMGLLASILSQKGPITQQFGNYNPALYKGINKSMRNTGVDIGVPEGTDVALPEGVWKVVEATKKGFNKGYGNSVLAQNVATGEKLRFSHLSNVLAAANQTLKGGSKIGKTGATGNVTGAHLDLEYYDSKGKLADVLKSKYGRGL